MAEIATCDKNHEMKLYIGVEIQWRSNFSSCRCKRTVKFFQSLKYRFLKSVRFNYKWSEELTSVKWIEKQLEMSQGTVVDWINFMR